MPKRAEIPVVHLELRTANLPRACAFYTGHFRWPAETVRLGSSPYLALDIGAGVIEREGGRPTRLPYADVADVGEGSDRAQSLGASVALGSRERPTGWRSVLNAPCGAEIAMWKPKT